MIIDTYGNVYKFLSLNWIKKAQTDIRTWLCALFEAPTFVFRCKSKSLTFSTSFHLNFKLICFLLLSQVTCDFSNVYIHSKYTQKDSYNKESFFMYTQFYFMLIGTFFPFISTCFVYKYLQSQTQKLHFYTVWCYCLPLFFRTSIHYTM